MQPVRQRPLGKLKRTDLQDIVADYIPPGANTFQVGTDRFRTGIAKLVKLRSFRGFKEDKIAVFILGSSSSSQRSVLTREPMLDNGLTSIGGRVWVTNAAVVAGWYKDVSTKTNDDLFDYVTAHMDLGQEPTILYDPRCSNLRFYPRGLAYVDDYEEDPLESQVTLEAILAEIQFIYEKSLSSPSAHSPTMLLWKDNKKWRPTRLAEQTVQDYLKSGLQSAFKSCNIRPEQPQASGRIDLLVEERTGIHPSSLISRVVLELKILRSFGSNGQVTSLTFVRGHITKGVNQASEYRVDRNAESSALCCFDMRKDDTGESCFVHVLERAARLKVVLRRWFIYSTDEAFRAARAERV